MYLRSDCTGKLVFVIKELQHLLSRVHKIRVLC